jgi:hypothetical protein
VRRCQKCQKSLVLPFGTFGTPSVSVFEESTRLLWERKDQCPGAVPTLVCHDEVVVECDIEQAVAAKAWLGGAMIESMAAVINGMGRAPIPVEVEARIARSWGEKESTP